MRAAMSSDSGSVVGGASDGESAARAPEGALVPVARKGRVQRPAHLVYILIAAESGGFWHGALEDHPRRGIKDTPKKPQVLGLLLARVNANGLDSPTTSALHRRLRELASAEARRASTQGFLEYEVDLKFSLEQPVEVGDCNVAADTLLQSMGE